MFSTILERFYTGFISRDLVYIVCGFVPWYVLNGLLAWPQSFSVYGDFDPYVQYGLILLGSYLTGLLSTEILAMPKLLKINPQHRFQCSWLSKIECALARGKVTFGKEIEANYSAYLVLLEQKQVPMESLQRIVFLKHLTSCMTSSFFLTAIVFLSFHHCWFGITSAAIASVCLSLNWYFWRLQFNTVDFLCVWNELFWRRDDRLTSGQQLRSSG